MDNKSANEVIIFDTTLRDGEQAPGYAMTVSEKLDFALSLDDLGVDVIEAGFPVASLGEFKAVNQISKNIPTSIICGFSRALEKDIKTAAEALKPVINKGRGRIQMFIPVSDLHLDKKMGISRQDALSVISKSIKYARQYTDDVQIGFEDASRADLDFLCRASEEAINAGAKTLGFGDTVGYAMPDDITQMIYNIRHRVPNIDKVMLSMHCHNDLGMAVANSLAAFKAGARQVEVTMNGIGERAGNASLEEVVMAIYVRKDKYPYVYNLDTAKLMDVSEKLSKITGIAVSPNKAIVGANAFCHGSGIHQAGVLKGDNTYHIMTPEIVGQSCISFTFTKHSGLAGFKSILDRNGVNIDQEVLQMAFNEAISLSDEQKVIPDEQVISIVHEIERELSI